MHVQMFMADICTFKVTLVPCDKVLLHACQAHGSAFIPHLARGPGVVFDLLVKVLSQHGSRHWSTRGHLVCKRFQPESVLHRSQALSVPQNTIITSVSYYTGISMHFVCYCWDGALAHVQMRALQ